MQKKVSSESKHCYSNQHLPTWSEQGAKVAGAGCQGIEEDFSLYPFIDRFGSIFRSCIFARVLTANFDPIKPICKFKNERKIFLES